MLRVLCNRVFVYRKFEKIVLRKRIILLYLFQLNEELIRISITWVEMWSECLEDASRVYFTEKDIGKMFRLLHPLHVVMERGHETIHEATFLQEFGTELTNCRLYCEHFELQGTKPDLQQAWEGYYTLYRNVGLHSLRTSVDRQFISAVIFLLGL